jgi:recombination protein RecT
LGMRTGQYRTINVSLVHEGELVSHNHFTGEMTFVSAAKVSDKIIGYVAYFKLINGFEKYYYMTTEEVHSHGKRYSQSFSKENAKWKTDFDAMAQKTVIKMLLSKFGILSIEMQTAIQADQAVVSEAGDYTYPDSTEATVIPVEPGASLKDKVKAANKATEDKKEERRLAPGPCPDDPTQTKFEDWCTEKCDHRVGCPTWE